MKTALLVLFGFSGTLAWAQPASVESDEALRAAAQVSCYKIAQRASSNTEANTGFHDCNTTSSIGGLQNSQIVENKCNLL